MTRTVLGIDIAKETVAVALLDGTRLEPATFPNTPEGAVKVLTWLDKRKVAHVHACMEATGTYGEALALALHEAGHTVSVINPARIAAYAKSQLARNKTDAVDAQLIARFCLKEEPPAWIPPAPEVRDLRALVRYLADLQAMRQAEANRRQAGSHPAVVQHALEDHLAFLSQQIAQVHTQIDAHIDQHPELRRQRDLLVSIKGIGERTAALLLAELGDMTAFANARALAAFAGLTPRQFSSGSSVHKRTRLSKLGNATIRKALFFPAIVAKQHNPIVHAFCARLLAAPKSPMAVVGAAMRKLIHLAYGVLKTGKPFDPNHQPGLPGEPQTGSLAPQDRADRLPAVAY
jgi:transposase